MVSLEICVESVADAMAAEQGGADRLELCSALAAGGITPSLGLVQRVLEVAHRPVMVLIRPRAGSFVYSADELEVMFTDVDLMQRAGVAGVVLGALTPDGEVDVPACRALLSRCSSVSRTFHRAFDLVADPSSSLEQIIAIGFDRVLSSGQRPSAVEGRDRLAELIRQAEGRIALMPGGGIRPDNVRIILDATGANEIHSSASVWLPEAGAGRDAWGGAGRITCRSTVHQLRLAIDETAPPTDHGSIFTFQ